MAMRSDVSNIFDCGCSRIKVAAGLCDIYAPDGNLRPQVERSEPAAAAPAAAVADGAPGKLRDWCAAMWDGLHKPGTVGDIPRDAAVELLALFVESRHAATVALLADWRSRVLQPVPDSDTWESWTIKRATIATLANELAGVLDAN